MNFKEGDGFLNLELFFFAGYLFDLGRFVALDPEGTADPLSASGRFRGRTHALRQETMKEKRSWTRWY